MVFLLALLVARPQDDLERAVRELVEKLKSDQIDERASAVDALRALGDRALGHLRKAEAKADPEARGRLRGLIAEMEWRPLLPPWFERVYPQALTTLTSASDQERFGFISQMAEHDLLPLDLANRIVLTDSSPEARRVAARILTFHPRRQYLPAFLQLLESLPALVAQDRGDRRLGTHDEMLPTVVRLLEALAKVIEPGDAETIRHLSKGGNPEIAGAADLLLAKLGQGPDRRRLEEILSNCVYPIAACAAEELGRRFGPEALRAVPTYSSTFARWRMEEARIQGLVENGSPESIRALERHARALEVCSSRAAFPLLARAGSIEIARALLDYALKQKESYQKDPLLDAVRSMPPETVLKVLKEQSATTPELLIRFTSMILHHGDEEIVAAYLRVNGEPANLYYWAPPRPREEVTRACRQVFESGAAPWALRYAYRQLSIFEPEGRTARALKVLRDPAHPAFAEALPDFPSLPEADRRELFPVLTRTLEGAKDKPIVYAFGRVPLREWIDPLLRHARSKGDTHYAGLYSLVDSTLLSDSERIEIARETGFSYMWDSLQGRLPRDTWDGLRELAARSEPHVRVPIAKALITSGDLRPLPCLKESIREYPWGLAAVRVLSEGEASAEDLMKGCSDHFRHGSQAVGEVIMALSAISTPAIENFLVDQVKDGPLLVQLSRDDRMWIDPDGSLTAAVRALVNLRSPKYRAIALAVARSSQGSRFQWGLWNEAVKALGILRAEGGREEVVAWLEDAARCGRREWIEATYLDALGYLGEERDAELVRKFLLEGSTRVAAARTLGRLRHRAEYRRLEEPKTLRCVHEDDPKELARLLKSEWGLDIRISDGLRDPAENRVHGFTPVLRADGFQILTRLSDMLQGAPLWKDGHVELVDPVTAASHWTQNR